MIANRVEREGEGKALYDKLNAVVSRYLKLPMSYLGEVPQDSKLTRAVMQQAPVSIKEPDAKSSLAYERIAKTLMNIETDSQVRKRGMAAFFSHIVTRHF